MYLCCETFCLFVCLLVCLFVCLFVCLSACLLSIIFAGARGALCFMPVRVYQSNHTRSLAQMTDGPHLAFYLWFIFKHLTLCGRSSLTI